MNILKYAIAIGAAFAVLMVSACSATRDQHPVNPYVDDRVITANIKTLYAQNKAVAATDISVETLYGIVLLSGVAKSLEEKIAAANIAEQVDGVKAVHDNIVIQSDTSGWNTAPGDSAPALSL